MDYNTFKILMDRMPYVNKMRERSDCFIFIRVQKQEDIDYMKKNAQFMTSMEENIFAYLQVGNVFYFSRQSTYPGIYEYIGQIYGQFDQVIQNYAPKAADVYASMQDFITDLLKNAGNPIIKI